MSRDRVVDAKGSKRGCRDMADDVVAHLLMQEAQPAGRLDEAHIVAQGEARIA